MSKKGGTATQTNSTSVNPDTAAYIRAYREAAQRNAGIQAPQGLDGLDQYMNPFQDQVIGSIRSEGDRQLAGAANQAADMATKAGAFGGSRSAVLSAELQRGIGANTQAQVANTSMSGYQAAVQWLMAQRQMEMQQRNQSLGLMAGGMTPTGSTNTQTQHTPGDPWGFWTGLGGTAAGAIAGAI